MLVERFGGKVPDNMEDLLSLPGVGRKTANLILGDIYGKDGYVCDTHCIRITGRLGLTDGSKDPLKVEQQLRKVSPGRGQQLLPPHGAPRPRAVYGTEAGLRKLRPAGAVLTMAAPQNDR